MLTFARAVVTVTKVVLLILRFFRISSLKSDISNGALTQKEIFSYWLATTILFVLSTAPFGYKPSPQLWIYWLLYCAINLIGLRKCYLSNGGSSGVALSDKLVSLGWVTTVRGAVMLLLPLYVASIIFVGVIGAILGINESGIELLSEYVSYFVTLVYLAWVWLKTASHIRQLC